MEKNKHSIKYEISKMVFKIFVGFFLSCLLFMGIIIFLFSSNIVVSSNIGSSLSKSNITDLKNSKDVEKDIKKYSFDYVVYTNKNTIEDKRILDNDLQFAQQSKDMKKNITRNNAVYIYIPNVEGNTIIVRIPSVPEFSNLELRQKLSYNNLSFIIIPILFMIISIIIIARFVYKIKKEFQKIEDMISIVDLKSLELPNTHSKIKEFDKIINVLQEMSASLKKSIQTEIKQKDILKFQVSTLSHDIKTPLTIIRGNADLLRLDLHADEDKEYIKYIAAGTKTIEHYIDTMLQYTTLVNNAGFHKSEIKVKDLCEEIKNEMKGYLAGKEIRFLILFENEIDKFLGDGLEIKRALINICGNACDYAYDLVEMRISLKGTMLRFSIWNNGAHFTENAIAHAGDLFYRDSKRRNSTTHYGLGLPYAKEVARQHLGKLELINPQKGGAMVVFKISTQ